MTLIVVVWILSGILCAYIASEKNRNPWLWLLLGFCFGLFAIIAIAAVPKLE